LIICLLQIHQCALCRNTVFTIECQRFGLCFVPELSGFWARLKARKEPSLQIQVAKIVIFLLSGKFRVHYLMFWALF
jgi:hypothetical protein